LDILAGEALKQRGGQVCDLKGRAKLSLGLLPKGAANKAFTPPLTPALKGAQRYPQYFMKLLCTLTRHPVLHGWD
jgi:hypothetical protein